MVLLRGVKLVVRPNSIFGGATDNTIFPCPLIRGYFAALKNHKNCYPPKVKDFRSAVLIAVYAKNIEYADSLRTLWLKKHVFPESFL